MKVSVIGSGYVGLVSGTCFAEIGHQVTCIDIDTKKIDGLNKGVVPIFEPGLSELINRNSLGNRLDFSTSFDSVSSSDVVFIAVGTPSTESGDVNLEYLYESLNIVAKVMRENVVIVIKSTVPPGTSLLVKNYIKNITDKQFYLVSNPEFLKEGSAIDDFMRPDRVVVGHDGEFEGKAMDDLYAPLLRQGNPIFHMSNVSAELTKYAANSFLATKISFINEIAKMCDATGADIEEVRKGITSDKRIGPKFLYPGPGYGGSCFPKDVKGLLATGKKFNVDLQIVSSADKVNRDQRKYLYSKIENHFKNNFAGKIFSIWGVAFKPNTDDVRESPALYITKKIIESGGSVKIFDPVASDNFLLNMNDYVRGIERFRNKYDCLNGADALIVLTDWAEFKVPDFIEIKERLKRPVLFDSRNLYPVKHLLDMNFDYYAMGRFIK